MMRLIAFIFAVSALVPGCIKLDNLFFETEKASSIEKDYHGLPLTLSESPPEWIVSAEVEREIYISVDTGKPIDPTKDDSGDYIHGAFLHAPDDCPPERCPFIGRDITFLYQHGNSGHLFRYWYRAVALFEMGANVFIYTYRGYGLSSGKASRKNVLEDAATAMTYLKQRDDVDTSRIIAYGYSMGAIPTSHLVGRSPHKGDFLATILESALDSPDSSVDVSTGTEFPPGFFQANTPFFGPDFIKDAPDHPILQMHGSKDSRVFLIQAEQYYEVLKNRDNYTHYLGKEEKTHENWMREAGHRNVPVASFKGELHIPDYYDHKKNPSHCCIQSDEYQEQKHQAFLDAIGETDGDTMTQNAENYRALVTDWILDVLASSPSES